MAKAMTFFIQEDTEPGFARQPHQSGPPRMEQ
jgi:hypothetical protein